MAHDLRVAVGILDGQPFSSSGGKEHSVRTDEGGSGQSSGQIIVAAGEGAGKLNGVIRAQGMRSAEVSRTGNN